MGPGTPVRTVKEIIEFHYRDPHYGQELLKAAESTSGPLTEPQYLLDSLKDLRLSPTEGIDAALRAHDLDALFLPGSHGCWIGARAGYPSVIVLAGYTAEGRPLGVTFAGTTLSEPTLIRFAYALEQATGLRRALRLGAPPERRRSGDMWPYAGDRLWHRAT